jgi:lipoate---protein ligase
MNTFDLTLDTPQANLACDEALLDLCEEGETEEILRFWEPQNHFVVLGYSNRLKSEVNVEVCKSKGIRVLRRCSGGGTVLQGPGCLNYSLILSIKRESGLKNIRSSNLYILNQHKKALEPRLGKIISIQGDSDLTLGNLKFSGNAQRRKKHFLLFHGTFLHAFNMKMMEDVLSMPSKAPDYRRGRPHEGFLVNMPLEPAVIKKALKKVWNAQSTPDNAPHRRIQKLMEDKYNRSEWNEKF